jgi:hypothetical protein
MATCRCVVLTSDPKNALTRTLDSRSSQSANDIPASSRPRDVETSETWRYWNCFLGSHIDPNYLECHRYKVLGLDQLGFLLSSCCMVKYANQLVLEEPTAAFWLWALIDSIKSHQCDS